MVLTTAKMFQPLFLFSAAESIYMFGEEDRNFNSLLLSGNN